MLNLRNYFQRIKPPPASISSDLEVVRRLAQHWARQTQLRVQEPIRLGEIVRFERGNEVQIPDDVRNYLENANGFSAHGGAKDDAGFRFLPLDEFQRVEALDGGGYHFEGDHGFYVFCDYLDFCWAYAICLTQQHPQGQVVIIGTKDNIPQPVANSFTEFAEMYLRDDEKLYPMA